MSSPLRLIERYKSSIQTIKLIHKNCLIFENLFFDNYEYFERILTNLNKYLMQYDRISHEIYSYLSQLIIELKNYLKNLTKILYSFDCLIIKCSNWLKNYSKKSIFSQLKSSKKQFDKFLKENNLTKKFSTFQTNYQQQCLQMDSIESEHMKLFLESIQLFSSIINIDQKEILQKSKSDFEIKAIENYPNDNENKYVHESNLSWSFTIAKTKEDLMVCKIKIYSQL